MQSVVGDDVGDLVVRREDIHVRALRKAGVAIDLFDGERGLRADLGVLEHDGVAEDEVRGREAGDLIVGIVPRHDAEDDADALLANEGTQPVGDLELLVSQPFGGMLGEGLGDVAGERGLADGLVERLAHLAVDYRAQLILALTEEVGRLLGQGGALGQGGGAGPRGVGLSSRGQSLLDLRVRRIRVFANDLACRRIRDSVHSLLCLPSVFRSLRAETKPSGQYPSPPHPSPPRDGVSGVSPG